MHFAISDIYQIILYDRLSGVLFWESSRLYEINESIKNYSMITLTYSEPSLL